MRNFYKAVLDTRIALFVYSKDTGYWILDKASIISGCITRLTASSIQYPV